MASPFSNVKADPVPTPRPGANITTWNFEAELRGGHAMMKVARQPTPAHGAALAARLDWSTGGRGQLLDRLALRTLEGGPAGHWEEADGEPVEVREGDPKSRAARSSS